MRRTWSVCSFVVALLVGGGAATAQTYMPLAHFSGEEGEPTAGLIRGSDGSYYGTTRTGGKYGLGSVYRITAHGDTLSFETLHAFVEAEGATISGALVQANDGYFYGTASTGGPSGSGTVFRMSRSGHVRLLHAFDRDTTGELPLAGLIQASDGLLYGTTLRGGAGNSGTVFRVDTTGAIAVLHAFDYWSTGASSAATLIEGRDHLLYGTTMAGGAHGQGVLFSIDVNGSLTVLHSFDQRTTGSSPNSGVIQGRDGYPYGTTVLGGAFGGGTLFRATTTGQVTVLHTFDPSHEGGYASARLTQGHDGALYGATTSGASGGAGTVFRAETNGGLTVLHAFDVTTTGRYAAGALIEIRDGAFYGTAARGGPYGSGTVFRVERGSAQLLHAFVAGPGTLPLGGLTQTSDGDFYGTTRQRGGWDAGAVFRLRTDGSLRRLYGFDGKAGQYPSAALLEIEDGSLLGTAEAGGDHGAGTVFRATRKGRVEAVHSFTRADGEDPKAALVHGSDGYLYGTTCSGGVNHNGTVYRLHDRTVSVAGAFDYDQGVCPSGAVVEASDGAFYGTTYMGGPGGNGTIFRMEPSGEITVVHAFSSATGAFPMAALVRGTDGFLYGTAYSGGAHGFGTVFRLEPPRTLRVLHSFDGATTGGYPAGALLLGGDGFLYGTTSAGFWGTTDSGAAHGFGTIFRIDHQGNVTTVHAFDGADGANPVAPLIEGRDGRLYSTTALGGKYGAGVAFRVSMLGVHILTPNGGDSFHPGKPTEIRWTATGTPLRFEVELSRNGGETFVPIRQCTALEGSARSCMWKPTGPLTGEAVIRVTAFDVNGDVASDETDGRFAIRPVRGKAPRADDIQ